MISLGCSNWYLRQLPCEQALHFIKHTDFSYAEISSEQLLLHSSDPLTVGSVAQKLGLKLTWHAPHYDLNLTSRNPKIRSLALEQIIESMRQAHEAKAILVVFHPGRKTFSADNPKPYWQWQKQALTTIGQKAAELKLLVGLELMERKPCELIDSP